MSLNFVLNQGVLFAFGDVISQKLIERKKINWGRTGRFGLVGFFFVVGYLLVITLVASAKP